VESLPLILCAQGHATHPLEIPGGQRNRQRRSDCNSEVVGGRLPFKNPVICCGNRNLVPAQEPGHTNRLP
jgi:hypothetical protein